MLTIAIFNNTANNNYNFLCFPFGPPCGYSTISRRRVFGLVLAVLFELFLAGRLCVNKKTISGCKISGDFLPPPDPGLFFLSSGICYFPPPPSRLVSAGVQNRRMNLFLSRSVRETFGVDGFLIPMAFSKIFVSLVFRLCQVPLVS